MCQAARAIAISKIGMLKAISLLIMQPVLVVVLVLQPVLMLLLPYLPQQK
jgi:hypothetical protein